MPHGPAFDRAVCFVVDVTLYNPGRETLEVALFPWAMLVGQRFYGEPEHEVRAWNDGPFHLLEESRNRRRALVGRFARSRSPWSFRCANRCCSSRCAARRCCTTKGEHLDDVTPEQAELREPAHLRRLRVPHHGRARRARIAALGRRLSQRRHRKEPARARSAAARSARAARHAAIFCRQARRRALHDAVAGDQPRRRVGQSQHAANHQGVSARLGFDQLAAVGHSRLARYVVVRPRLRLFLAGIQPQRARSLQPLQSKRAG